MNFILSNARETEVESKGKTFRLAAVVLDDWCCGSSKRNHKGLRREPSPF